MDDGIYRGLCGPEDFRVKPKPQDDFGFKKAERFSTDELVDHIAPRKWYPIRHGDRKWSISWCSYSSRRGLEIMGVVGWPWLKFRKTPPSRA